MTDDSAARSILEGLDFSIQRYSDGTATGWFSGECVPLTAEEADYLDRIRHKD